MLSAGYIGAETRTVVIESNNHASIDALPQQQRVSDALLDGPAPLLHKFASRMGLPPSTLRMRVSLDTYDGRNSVDSMNETTGRGVDTVGKSGFDAGAAQVAVPVSQWMLESRLLEPRLSAPNPVCADAVFAAIDVLVDAERAVFASAEVLRRHGFLHGDWVSFSVDGSTGHTVMAQVCASPEGRGGSAGRTAHGLVVSDGLWQRLASLQASEATTWLAVRVGPPPAAARAWVARVEVPQLMHEDDNEAFSKALIKYARIPRVLGVGDVVSLRRYGYAGYARVERLSRALTQEDTAEDHDDNDAVADCGDAHNDSLGGVGVRCGAMIVSETTALLELTSVASAVPPAIHRPLLQGVALRMNQVLAAAAYPHSANGDAGSGAVGGATHRSDDTYPAATTRMSAHPTLLLGPRGGGKRWWVERLAGMRGLHVHAVSCHHLGGSTAKDK